jgi:hypothetical protein
MPISFGRALTNRGAPFPIKQAKLGMPFQKGHALPKGARPSKRCAPFQKGRPLSHLSGKVGHSHPKGACPSKRCEPFQKSAPFPIHQTVCQELRMDGGIAKPGRACRVFPCTPPLPCQKQQWRPILACLARIPVTVEVSEFSLPTFPVRSSSDARFLHV